MEQSISPVSSAGIGEDPLPGTSAGSVSLIIPVTGPADRMKRCVESMMAHTPENIEIIFVDTGENEDTATWLNRHRKQIPSCLFIKSPKGSRLAAQHNAGIRASSKEFILLLSSELVVTAGWLSGMLECLKSIPDSGVVAPVTNHLKRLDGIVSDNLRTAADMESFARAFRTRNRNRRIPSRTISGFCMLFRRNLVEEIGFFEENFRSERFEYEEFCFRAALEGYRNLIAGDIFLHRDPSIRSSGNGVPDRDDERRHDKLVFADKWGGVDAESDLGRKIFSLNILEKATEAHQKGQIDKSVDTLLQGIGSCPDDERLYYTLSEVLLDVRQAKDALDVLEQMKTGRDDLKRLELMGYCRAGMGQTDRALEMADLVLSREPEAPSALNLKGIVAVEKGQGAESFFEKAIASDPGYGEPYARLGALKWDQGFKEEAFGLFERGFMLSPTVAVTMTAYHEAIASSGLYQQAEQAFREANLLYPHHERLKMLFIDILIRQGKYAAAMDEIEDAMVAFTVDDGFISAALSVRDRLGPKDIKKGADGKPTVSLCMIVKNEAIDLAKCLKSVSPVVDEMIVVDTGSTDNTRQLALVFGAKVYEFEWTNDFSEARNFSISKASGDWIFLLDADEVISPLDFRSLRKMVENPSKEPVAYTFVTRNYMARANTIGWVANDGKYDNEEAAEGWIPSHKVRLFPNDSRIRFEYPVHEMVEPSLNRAGFRVARSIVPIHHYGKLNTERSDCKGETYYQIGRKKLDELGDDPIALRELAIQAGLLKKWEEAIELWQRLIAIRPKTPEAFVNLGTAYWHMDEYEKALWAAEKAVALAPQMNESTYNYAICQLHLGNAQESVSALRKLLKRSPNYLPARFMLAAAYCCNSQKDKGIKNLEKLKITNTGAYMAVSCHELAKGLLSAGNLDYAILLLDAAVESGNVNKDVLTLFSECISKKRGTA